MAKKKRSVRSRLLNVLVGLGVFVVLLAVGLICYLGPIVEKAVNVGGPLILGVPVTVEKVSIHPVRGVIDLKKFYIGNPESYATDKPLFAVDSVHVSLDMKSLFSDVIAIRKIQIDRPQINYEVQKGKSNFDVLMENIGEAEKKKKDKKEKPKEDKKVTIDEFELTGAKVSYSGAWSLGTTIPISLPTLRRNDIGKSQGGVSGTQVALELVKELTNVIVTAGKALGEGVKDAAKSVGEGVKDAAKSVGSGAKDAVKSVEGGVKDAAKAIKKLF